MRRALPLLTLVTLALAPTAPAFAHAHVVSSTPAANAAMLTPRGQRYLRWSRFPFFIVDAAAGATRVFVNDYRYADAGGRAGWAGIEIDLPAQGH